MKTTRVSLTEAKQRLGELVKRVAYGGERIVLEFRGKPQAIILGCRDIDKTEPEMVQGEKIDQRKLFDEIDELREKIRRRTGVHPSSAEIVRELREQREDHLGDLH